MTGVAQAYEPPLAAELVVDGSGDEALAAQAARVVALLG